MSMRSIARSGVLDLDRAQSLIPSACDVRFQGVEIGSANGYNRGAGILARCGLAQKEDDFGHASRRQFQLCAHCGARIQRRADLVRQRRRARQRGRIRKRPVTAYELAPIARPIGLGAPHVGKSDTGTEKHIRGIACEERPCLSISLGFDKSESGGS